MKKRNQVAPEARPNMRKVEEAARKRYLRLSAICSNFLVFTSFLFALASFDIRAFLAFPRSSGFTFPILSTPLVSWWWWLASP